MLKILKLKKDQGWTTVPTSCVFTVKDVSTNLVAWAPNVANGCLGNLSGNCHLEFTVVTFGLHWSCCWGKLYHSELAFLPFRFDGRVESYGSLPAPLLDRWTEASLRAEKAHLNSIIQHVREHSQHNVYVQSSVTQITRMILLESQPKEPQRTFILRSVTWTSYHNSPIPILLLVLFKHTGLLGKRCFSGRWHRASLPFPRQSHLRPSVSATRTVYFPLRSLRNYLLLTESDVCAINSTAVENN